MRGPKVLTSGPVSSHARLLSLDVLRGFAIFGVLLAFSMWSLGPVPAEELNRLDASLGLFLEFIVDSKFYTILSFLFGLGFFLLMERTEARGANVTAIYCRRLGVLAVFGLLHGLLLRDGDILVPYAVTGLLLLPFRGASNRVLLSAAVAMVFYPTLAREILQTIGYSALPRPQTEGLGHFAHNFEWLRHYYSLAPYWPGHLATFLLGFYAGRNRILQRAADRPRTLWGTLIAGLGAGLALFIAREWYLQSVTVSKPSDWERFVATMLMHWHAWATATGYVAAILLLLRSERWRHRSRPLAAAGRIALTNYVMQAALVIPICIAFGLYDNFTPSRSLALALAVFLLIQVPFSLWWLRSHKLGPLEWLWRRLTYGKKVQIS